MRQLIRIVPERWANIQAAVKPLDYEDLRSKAVEVYPKLLCPEEREECKDDDGELIERLLWQHATQKCVDESSPWMKEDIYRIAFEDEDLGSYNCLSRDDFDEWCRKNGPRILDFAAGVPVPPKPKRFNIITKNSSR